MTAGPGLGDREGPLTIYGAAVVDYRRLNWPAFTQGTLVWTTPGVAVEALNMPAETGGQVLAELTALGVQPPAFAIPGPNGRCVILVQPRTAPPVDVVAVLKVFDIGYAHGGYYRGRASQWGLDLPPTRHPGHQPYEWITAPDIEPPRLDLVVDTIIQVVS